MDEKLEYFKKKILAHLDDLEQKENAEKKELKKSLLAFEMTSIEKAGYPVGTIREWKGKKYIKVAPKKWKPKYDSHSRGAKMAIAALKKKIDACTDSEELMQIILENRDRFSDENGRPLPFVKELSDYISGRNDTIESEKNEKKATDEKIKNHFEETKQSKQKNEPVKADSVKNALNNEEKVKFVNKLSGEVYHDYETDPSKFAVYAKDGKSKGLAMTQDIADIINSHSEASVYDWANAIAEDVNKKYPNIRKEYVKTSLSAIRMGYRNGDKEKVMILPDSKEEPKNIGFTLDDIRHIGDGKETKKVNDMETAKNVIKQIAEKYGATEKGRKELSDFIALNIGGSNPLYDKIYEEFNISYEDLDMDSDACHDLMLNQSLGKDTKEQREQISDSKSEFEDNYRQMLENEDDRYKEDEKIKRGKEIDALVDSKAKEYAEDSYTKHVAQDSIKRLGEKKLTQYANLNVKDDKEFLSELKKKIAETEEENGEPVSEYTIGTAVWNHYHKKYAKEFAQEKLKTMYQNEQDKGEDIPVDEKDMSEAENIIGADVKRILEGRDTFGNAKQGLVDKIKRRIRNNPGVARAMLVYIQKEQEKTGKKVFTDKHSIWEELPKLNENARKAKANGESETKTGVSGNLYEGEDGTTVVENKDWGRYQISFPGKPDGETISMLKRNGFRWSPSTKTWVCFNTANGEYSLKRVAEKLGLKKNDEVKKSLFDSLEDSFPYDDEMDSEDEIKKAVADVLDELAQGDI